MPITKRVVPKAAPTHHPHYVPADVAEPPHPPAFDPDDALHVAAYRLALCERALFERARKGWPTADVHIHRGMLRQELLARLTDAATLSGNDAVLASMRISVEP